jgi:subtilisin family serine protease
VPVAQHAKWSAIKESKTFMGRKAARSSSACHVLSGGTLFERRQEVSGVIEPRQSSKRSPPARAGRHHRARFGAFSCRACRTMAVLAVCLALTAASCHCGSTPTPPSLTPAPVTTVSSDSKLIRYDSPGTELIPGTYVVGFMPAVSAPSTLAASLIQGTSGAVDYVFTSAFEGFVATNVTDAWAEQISRRADIAYVRPDFRIGAKDSRGGVFDPVAWQLDRVDQHAPFTLDRDFRYKTGPITPGANVPVYIIDNGINVDHNEFSGSQGSRVQNLIDVTGHSFAQCVAADGGHGTSVASLAAGNTLGITPTVIKNVKVLDHDLLGTSCTAGSPAQVAEGLEEAYKDMLQTNDTRAVINLSVGWTQNTPDVTAAVAALRQRGAIVVAAAGNENSDASATTPANISGVVAVGGTTDQDKRFVISPTVGSNYGPTVSLWAPGYNVLAADWPASNDPQSRTSVTGTSFAAPLVAGAAVLMWEQKPSLTSQQVIDQVTANATRNMLSDLGAGSNNALLFLGEDTPTKLAEYSTPKSPNDPRQVAKIRVSHDGTRLYVAGSGAFAYAAFDTSNIAAGPIWRVAQNAPLDIACNDIYSSGASAVGGKGEVVYFGCTGNATGGRGAMIVSTQNNHVDQWPQPFLFGAGTTLTGIAEAYIDNVGGRVFALTTKSVGGCVQTDITAIDADSGMQVASAPLIAAGFSEACNAGVGIVPVETPDGHGGTSVRLVAASSADPPGPDKAFLWRINPVTLAVEEWSEVTSSILADPAKGMFATALAVQPYEGAAGYNVQQPPVVFLSTAFLVDPKYGPGESGIRSAVYRLDSTFVHGSRIKELGRIMLDDLWAENGDLFWSGLQSNGGTFGADSAVIIGMSEGVYFSPGRWTLTSDRTDPLGIRGVSTFGSRDAYIVTESSSTIHVAQYVAY